MGLTLLLGHVCITAAKMESFGAVSVFNYAVIN